MNPVVQSTMERIVEAGLAEQSQVRGCTEDEILELEKAFGLGLPNAYRDFLRAMGHGAGAFLRGSDLWYRDLVEINEAAAELVAEVELSLPPAAFVFAMHQGYQFLFFLAAGSDDPEVRRFAEGEGTTIVASRFTDWLVRASEDEIR